MRKSTKSTSNKSTRSVNPFAKSVKNKSDKSKRAVNEQVTDSVVSANTKIAIMPLQLIDNFNGTIKDYKTIIKESTKFIKDHQKIIKQCQRALTKLQKQAAKDKAKAKVNQRHLPNLDMIKG